jgi:tetratricopeptide (TPR) repeat protein
MSLEPATAQDIAAACASLRALGPFPPAIARGLAADDPDQMRAAATHLIEAGRAEGLRPLVERLRERSDFGVWARVTSARLHQAKGEFAQGVADLDDLMQRFPARAAAHWWIAKARCLQGLKRDDEAEAAVREAIERFPDSTLPRGFLANLLSRRQRPAEALEVWRAMFARFPAPELEWFVSLANALRALGRRDEGLAALEDGAARFPADRRSPPLLAEVAQERSQWALALAIWEDYGGDDEPAVIGRARALLRLGRIDEATQALERFLARNPDSIPALRELAAISAELGEARARDLFGRLTTAQGATKPEWWAALARAHHDLGEYDAGAAALAQLERRFPASALAEGERLRLAKERETGHDALEAMIAAALKRFPADFDLRSHGVWMALSRGRIEEAEREVEALEADKAPGFALTARLRLEAHRSDEALRDYAESFLRERTWDVADAMQVAYALLDARAPWAFALGGAIMDAAAARFPGHARLNLMRIRLMIARREDEAALALIDAIPQRYARRDFLEIRAWAAAKRGSDAEAKGLWRQSIATNYYAAVHGPIGALNRVSPDDRPGPEAGVTAYVVFRNEAAQIPGFLAHHRRLGVRRFVFFDHLSSDGGRDLALREPDVIVYDCPGSYQLSWSGRRWVNEIVAREGARGWGLQLDMDEHLIYPGCESVGIDRLVAWLDAQGFEAMRGYMLDLFAPRLGDAALQSEHRWYDEDYYWFGFDRPPYLSPGGGVRARLFEAKEYLHKVPLWRLDAGLLINSHETTHMRFADVSSALLHYKLMNVALRGNQTRPEEAATTYLEADAGVEAIRRHARYAERLDRLWRSDLVKPGVSRELSDSLTLAGRGLMAMSDDYRRWLEGR